MSPFLRPRRIEYAYQDDGKLSTVTSYDATTGGNIVNQVKYTYDGWGQTKSEQSHAGAVTTGTPGVTYTYEDGEVDDEAKYVRLRSMTYPGGRVVYSIYETTPAGRLVAQSENSGGTQRIVEYDYLGMSTIVKESRPMVTNGLVLNYDSAFSQTAIRALLAARVIGGLSLLQSR